MWHKMGCWGRATVGIRLGLDYNLLYNKRNHLCCKSPIIRYPEQPSI